MNAAFMPFQPHESGIHAVWPGAGEGSVTEVRFRHAGRAAGRDRAAGATGLGLAPDPAVGLRQRLVPFGLDVGLR